MAIFSDLAFIEYCKLTTELYSNTSLLVREEFDRHAEDRKLSPFMSEWPRKVIAEALKQLRAANRDYWKKHPVKPGDYSGSY